MHKIDDVQTVLAERQASVRSRAINLRNFEVLGNRQFRVDGIELYVPERDDHPIKQLCSLIGMSLGFYKANPSVLNTTIFATRLQDVIGSTPANATGEERKSKDNGDRMLRFRADEIGNRLLSILPMQHQTVTYMDALRPVIGALPPDAVISLSNHDRVDIDHHFTLRARFPKFSFEAADRDPIEMGLYMDMSEDGLNKFVMTSFLERLVCTNGAMQTFDEHPYFEYNYRGIRPMDLGAAMTSAIDRFGQDLAFVHSRVLESTKLMMSKDEMQGFLLDLENRRTVSSGFIRKIRKELVAQDIQHISRWRVINEITQRAQGLPHAQRVQHEFVAGGLLGLNVHQDQ